MEENQAWETSMTGGPVISMREAARQLGLSPAHLRRIMSELGLKPATPYNPTRQRQHIDFYLADVEAAKRRSRNPKTAVVAA